MTSKIDPMGMLSVPEGSIITPSHGKNVIVVTPGGPVYEVRIIAHNGVAAGVFEGVPGEISLDRLSEVGLKLRRTFTKGDSDA